MDCRRCLQFAYDADNGKAWFGINNTWYQANGSSTTLSAVEAGTNATFVNFAYDSEYFFTTDHHDAAFTHNYGQRPFVCTPPSGYKSLCTQNLADPPIADGSDYFGVKPYDGTANYSTTSTYAQTITGLGFSPDFVWIKNRTTDVSHNLFDSVRGIGASVSTNSNNAEYTDTTKSLTDFTSDGFEVTDEPASSTDTTGWGVNIINQDYVAWAWDAGSNSNKTYNVTVVSDSGNKYRFDGHGTSAVTLDLEEGSTYVFDSSDSSVNSHPFVIGTSANSNEYSTGVTYTLDGVTKTYSQYTSGFAAATTRKLTITIPSGAPTLYYWCSAHSGMGGQINTNSTAGATVLSGSIQKYDQSQTWSGDVTGTAYSASYPKTNAFDGNLETRSVGDTNGLTFTPSSAITVNTSLRIWVDYADSSATNVLVVNGTDYSSLLTVTGYDLGWITIPNISSITSIAYGKAPSGSEKCSISAIEVDGAILVDSNLTPPAIPSINSIVRANPSAGFSIVTYTGTGANASIGHGLNAAPEFFFGRNRDDTSGNLDWIVYHQSVGNTGRLKLNGTGGTSTSSTFFQDTSPNQLCYYNWNEQRYKQRRG